MIDRNHQSEQFRRAIRGSTDPQWVREQYGIHQHSSLQIFAIVTLAITLVLACSVVW